MHGVDVQCNINTPIFLGVRISGLRRDQGLSPVRAQSLKILSIDRRKFVTKCAWRSCIKNFSGNPPDITFDVGEMNSIRAIQSLNKRELENNVSTEASWHADYRDTAYIYIGGLPFDFSEGDVLTIFSQFGEPTYINLVRDKETGKSKGFAFLKYEDQRSTDLAVDNLGGATVMGRVMKVDHTRYKKKDGVEETGMDLGAVEVDGKGDMEEEESEEERPLLKEEQELYALIRDHDEDDPMKEYLVKEKKEEVAKALAILMNKKPKERKHRHHHRKHDDHRHRSRKHGEGNGFDQDRHRKHKSSRRRSRSP